MTWSDYDVEPNLAKHVPTVVDCTQDLVHWLKEIEERMWNLDCNTVRFWEELDADWDESKVERSQIAARVSRLEANASRERDLRSELMENVTEDLKDMRKLKEVRLDEFNRRLDGLYGGVAVANRRIAEYENQPNWLALFSLLINLIVITYLLLN